MVEDDLLPDANGGGDDDSSIFEIGEAEETPDTNSRRGSSVSGASLSGNGAPTPSRNERDPNVARFFENFGEP